MTSWLCMLEHTYYICLEVLFSRVMLAMQYHCWVISNYSKGASLHISIGNYVKHVWKGKDKLSGVYYFFRYNYFGHESIFILDIQRVRVITCLTLSSRGHYPLDLGNKKIKLILSNILFIKIECKKYTDFMVCHVK
jgi:hypothetical protein